MSEPMKMMTERSSRQWYVLKCRRQILKSRDILHELRKSHAEDFEFFLPTRFVVEQVGGRRRRVEKAVAFNFAFVNCRYALLRQLVEDYAHLFLLQYRRMGQSDTPCLAKDRLLVVPDAEMEMFMRTIGAYDGTVPALLPEEADLEKGDRVRIIGGQFDGIEGILVTRQGKDGGRVLVKVSEVMCVPTLEIEPEYIEVLEFAPESRHLYKKFDSYIQKIRHTLKACLYHEMGLSLPPAAGEHLRAAYANTGKGQTEAAMFLRRFGNFRPATLNQRARKLVFLLMSYKVTGQVKAINDLLAETEDFDRHLTAVTQQAFLRVYLYAVSGQRRHLELASQAVKALENAKKSDLLRNMLAEDLRDFRLIYGHG